MVLAKNILKAVTSINDIIDSVFAFLCKILLSVMTLCVAYQVLMRYVFNNPPGWTEESALYSMCWMTFLAAPIVYRNNLFIRIDLIFQKISPKQSTNLRLAFLAIETSLLSIFLYYSIIFTQGGRFSVASTLGISMFYIYMCLPIGFSTMLLVSLEKILKFFIEKDGHF